MILVLLSAVICLASCILAAPTTTTPTATTTECPQFGKWNDWTDKCLWFPMNTMREDIADACKVQFNTTNEDGFADLMPAGFKIPEKCGHCSFKFRCRNRQRTEGCLSVEGEKQTCSEFGDVCDLPPAPVVGCRWGMFADVFKACTARPDIPDWRRESYKKFLNMMPDGNCIEKDGRCKCCCHPFQPNEDGTACVKVEEKTCPAFEKPNDWSQCLWFPISNVIDKVKDHCDLDFKSQVDALPTPAGFTIPDKCGMCSFRVRCSKREKQDGCFNVDIDKKACGTEDCPGCADVCTIPYVNGTSCNWTEVMGKDIFQKLETITNNNKLPLWRKRGMKDLFKNMPYGKCKDINGQCKCCCHPYEPNADGTKCVLADMCTF
jgi:hypothetical protein